MNIAKSLTDIFKTENTYSSLVLSAFNEALKDTYRETGNSSKKEQDVKPDSSENNAERIEKIPKEKENTPERSTVRPGLKINWIL